MARKTRRFHNAFLMLLIAALIPASMALFSQPATAYIDNIPIDPDDGEVVDVINGIPCTFQTTGQVEYVRNGCCYANDGSTQFIQYDEYRCSLGRNGYRWRWVREWCTSTLCFG